MLNFQEMIAKLTQFWAGHGCVVHQGYDLEVGAGTFNPATFLRCLGPEPYAAVYVEPSRRPQDGRYGENPNRVQFYHQMQVIIKPSPTHLQDLYLQSLEAIGFNLNEHDIRFVHDDWENPTIGAWGLGWEVWADGMEVSQFTYFQAVGGLPVHPVSGEITYGLERLAMYIQGVDSMFDLKWSDDITYGDIYQRSEFEWSHYNFTEADTAMWLRHFDDFEAESQRLIQANFPIPAYDFIMKSSHAFNILDARGVISVTERTAYISRIRNLAKLLADCWIQSREKMQFPLLRNQNKKENIQIPDFPQTNDPEEKRDFLLEIGSEELPATFVPIGIQQLESKMRKLLQEHELEFEKIEMFGTPRRLAILINGLSGGTLAKRIEKKGPPVAAAFQPNGELSTVGEGFLRSIHFKPVTRNELEEGKHPGLEIRLLKEVPYLFATFEQQGISTRQLLQQKLSQLILDLEFPKKMKWSDLEIEYARPLKWIVSLYGHEIIPFAVGNIVAANYSYGHRQLAPQKIVLLQAKEYSARLKEKWVLAAVKEREISILEQLEKIERQKNGQVVAKERVLSQVLHLVEYPFLTTADFDVRFLQAPKEVCISEMVEHQKYFPLANKEGHLIPHFVIVCNNKPTDLIRNGNQKALSPRLADGMFLYEEDLKIPLNLFNEKLSSITFQKELGSIWEKVKRLMAYCEVLHGYLPICDLKMLLRSAKLCKADLASHLVGEFPELQGVIGKIYALKQGEKYPVAVAIEEHWLPKGDKSPLPQTPNGTLLSLAEKIDNFLSCFALNLKPTSSSDPYALRRQAIGILKMLLEGEYYLPLQKIFKDAIITFLKNPNLSSELKENIQENQNIIIDEILDYFQNRYRILLLEYDFEKGEIEAIFNRKLNDVFDTFCQLQALHDLRITNRKAFASLMEIYTRVKKIVNSQYETLSSEAILSVDPTLFQDKVESHLYEMIQKIQKDFHHDFLDRRDPAKHQWQDSFILMTELQLPLNQLFEKVKIMDENSTIRNNRLALLKSILDLSTELADFSKIQEQ